MLKYLDRISENSDIDLVILTPYNEQKNLFLSSEKLGKLCSKLCSKPIESLVKTKISTRHQAKNTPVTDSSKQIDSTLEELTQQVSAIREYTAFQQNRLEKLQDGYDWNIIKNFGLRIIRCIDNLETRIDRLVEEDIDATALMEMRDELVFALESSGIEQFKPEINSDYRGQEKFAEAVKARQQCKDSKKSRVSNI